MAKTTPQPDYPTSVERAARAEMHALLGELVAAVTYLAQATPGGHGIDPLLERLRARHASIVSQ